MDAPPGKGLPLSDSEMEKERCALNNFARLEEEPEKNLCKNSVEDVNG